VHCRPSCTPVCSPERTPKCTPSAHKTSKTSNQRQDCLNRLEIIPIIRFTENFFHRKILFTEKYVTPKTTFHRKIRFIEKYVSSKNTIHRKIVFFERAYDIIFGKITKSFKTVQTHYYSYCMSNN